jgi:hypothetical protein
MNTQLNPSPSSMRRQSRAQSIKSTLALSGALLLAAIARPEARAAIANPTIDLRVLVLCADGNDNTLPGIRKAPDFLGTPYTEYAAAQTPGGLTAGKLFNGTRSFYSGVILTTGSLGYSPDGVSWVSALNAVEWQTLWQWQADFGIRQLNWYSFPSPDLGFGDVTAIDTSVTPLTVNYSAAGSAAFSYVNTANPLLIKSAWTYLAFLATPVDTNTVALLNDAQGHALAAVKTYPDGRQVLTLTFDSNEWLRHNQILNYGLINWVSKGLFLGERRIYVSAQVDDLFIDDDIWTGGIFRMTGADLQAVINWQAKVQANALFRNFRYDMPYNGYGTTGVCENDTLTPVAKANQSKFKWINHTYEHENLDAVAYGFAKDQISKNNSVATGLGLTLFSRRNLVTPGVSGLENVNAMKAAYDTGVRFVVSDTSRVGYNNPSPNAGIYNKHVPGILMIPRHPNNLFYNVSTPAQWAGEYNSIYIGWWGRDLTYQEILDDQSELLLNFMLKGDMDPWMFHQPNLRAYDGTRTLLGDLLDLTFAKYQSIFKLPVLSPTMDSLGGRMAARMAYNDSGVKASIVPGQSITRAHLTFLQATQASETDRKKEAERTGGPSPCQDS